MKASRLDEIFSSVKYPKEDLEKVCELATREFEAVKSFKQNSNEIEQDAIRSFKRALRNYHYMKEFNKGEHKTIYTDVPSLKKASGSIWYIPSKSSKRTKKLNRRAEQRASSEANEATKLFKRLLNGECIVFENRKTLLTAYSELDKYNQLQDLALPTERELLCSFYTWIYHLVSQSLPNEKMIQEKTNEIISTFYSKRIPAQVQKISPYSIKYRTFEL